MFDSIMTQDKDKLSYVPADFDKDVLAAEFFKLKHFLAVPSHEQQSHTQQRIRQRLHSVI